MGWVCSSVGPGRGVRGYVCFVASRFSGCGIDHRGDLGDPIRGETALAGMLSYQSFIGSDVDAVDFVLGYVALNPLDFWAKFAEDSAGCL